jgi:hypothetical protein
VLSLSLWLVRFAFCETIRFKGTPLEHSAHGPFDPAQDALHPLPLLASTHAVGRTLQVETCRVDDGRENLTLAAARPSPCEERDWG